MDPRMQKVWRDLWINPGRTLLVILSIAVGIYGIGTIAETYTIMSTSMVNNSKQANLAEFKLATSTPFEEQFIESVRNLDTVESAEARQSVQLRLNAGQDVWKTIEVFAVKDYENMQVSKIVSDVGAWPPSDIEKEILLERDFAEVIAVNVGDTILAEMPDGTQRQLKVSGIAHDIDTFPSGLSGTLYGYVSFDTLVWLGGTRNMYNNLYVVPTDRTNRTQIQETINLLQDRFEQKGHMLYDIDVTSAPGESLSQTIVKAVLLILGILSGLSLLLSAFLVTNTVSALLAQQTRQTGIMKTIGASSGQVMGVYVLSPILFGLMSLIMAVPLATLSARFLSRYLLDIVNYDVSNTGIPLAVIGAELFVGLVLPLLASLIPILGASRISIREAVSFNGLSISKIGASGIENFLQKRLGSALDFSMELILSLRNLFRRRQRLLLTLLTLTLGSAIFMGVFSVRASVENTLDEASQYWQYSAEADFQQSYNIDRVRQEAMTVSGVTSVEGWGTYSTRRIRPDRSESANISLLGLPADSQHLNPILLEGRWLQPDDFNQIVIDTEVIRREPDLGVGDELLLKLKGQDQSFEIVGIVKGQLRGSIGYLNYPFYAERIGQVDSLTRVIIGSDATTNTDEELLVRNLEQQFSKAGLRVSEVLTVTELREETTEQFNIFILLLLFMAAVISLVGGLGLMGTMSLNVVERTREIGIMQTIGAASGSIMQIFITEGLIIGIISWLIGAVLAIPISSVLSDAAGNALLRTPLAFTFSLPGVALWLAVMIVLATLASFLPARSAARLSVREILAYE